MVKALQWTFLALEFYHQKSLRTLFVFFIPDILNFLRLRETLHANISQGFIEKEIHRSFTFSSFLLCPPLVF